MNRFTEVEKVKMYAIIKQRELEIKKKIEEIEAEETSYNSDDMKSEYDMILKYLYEENKMIENILKDLYHSDNNWSIAILRYFNPVGASKTGLIGEDPNGIPNNLMPYIVKVATKEYPQLNVFGNDYDTKDGTGVRDYIHVVDLAKGHVKALEKINKDTGIDCYNLGTGCGYSVLDLVETFKKVNKVDVPYKIVERRPGDIDACYADPSYAKEKLNWQAEMSIEDMCQDSYNFAIKQKKEIN